MLVALVDMDIALTAALYINQLVTFKNEKVRKKGKYPNMIIPIQTTAHRQVRHDFGVVHLCGR